MLSTRAREFEEDIILAALQQQAFGPNSQELWGISISGRLVALPEQSHWPTTAETRQPVQIQHAGSVAKSAQWFVA